MNRKFLQCGAWWQDNRIERNRTVIKWVFTFDHETVEAHFTPMMDVKVRRQLSLLCCWRNQMAGRIQLFFHGDRSEWWGCVDVWHALWQLLPEGDGPVLLTFPISITLNWKCCCWAKNVCDGCISSWCQIVWGRAELEWTHWIRQEEWPDIHQMTLWPYVLSSLKTKQKLVTSKEEAQVVFFRIISFGWWCFGVSKRQGASMTLELCPK